MSSNSSSNESHHSIQRVAIPSIHPYPHPHTHSSSPIRVDKTRSTNHSLASQFHTDTARELDIYLVKNRDLPLPPDNDELFERVLRQCNRAAISETIESNIIKWEQLSGKDRIGKMEEDWTNVLNMVAGSFEETELYFHSTHNTRMPSNGDPSTPRGSPDISVTLGSHDPAWEDCLFLGEVKSLPTDLDSRSTRGQISKYIKYLRQANPMRTKIYLFTIAHTDAMLWEFSPICCRRSPLINCRNGNGVARLFAALIKAARQPDTHNMRWPLANTISLTNVVIQGSESHEPLSVSWQSEPKLIFFNQAIFGRLTAVWSGTILFKGMETDVILKSTFIREALANNEAQLLNRLQAQTTMSTFPELLCSGFVTADGACVYYYPSAQAELEDDQRRVQSILITKNTHNLQHLYGLKLWNIFLCLRDCARSIWSAFHEASILHRDVSVGNLCGSRLHIDQPANANIEALFDPRLELDRPLNYGILIDWGNGSLVTTNRDQGKDNRSGTVPFMAARIHRALELGEPIPTHHPFDDLEGVVYLALWHIEAWWKSGQPRANRATPHPTVTSKFLSQSSQKYKLAGPGPGPQDLLDQWPRKLQLSRALELVSLEDICSLTTGLESARRKIRRTATNPTETAQTIREQFQNAVRLLTTAAEKLYCEQL